MCTKHLIKAFLPTGILDLYKEQGAQSYVYSKRTFRKFYRNRNKHIPPCKKTLVYMADGRIGVGGLADRLQGMVSLYALARELDVDFKLYMSSPCDLTNFLVPNQYDWRIDDAELCFDTRQSIIHYLGWDCNKQRALKIITRSLQKYNQLHITTMVDIAAGEYGPLFDELFKPSPELQSLIDKNVINIGTDFISATFRFQQLLGDFAEWDFPTLDEGQKNALIDKCLDHLDEVHQENPAKKVLVTSDSTTFLMRVKEIPYVHIIEGKLTHIDYTVNLDASAYMKSFVDYYLLTKSQKVYLIVDGNMYNSGFPRRAAVHGKHQFITKKYW